MKPVESYRGREQTYLKHFFLERYLERVAYVIGYSHPEFVYVDGFSGPWKSEDEQFADTSFMIAIEKLREVRDGLARAGKRPRVRCLFVEKDRTAFKELEGAISEVADIEVKALHGTFESVIPDILSFVGRSFSLVFIDPTGWTGFGLSTIQPILQLKGEVLVNFMFDYVNRFLKHPSFEIESSIDEVFGGPVWRDGIDLGVGRESAIVDIYRERLRSSGGFPYVTSTRILQPIAERSYFYLVYGTRHVKGLLEFRGVEKRFVSEQERVRVDAKRTNRVERSGQHELFDSATPVGPPSFEDERSAQLDALAAEIRKFMCVRRSIRYDDVLAALLERPLLWESDIKGLVAKMQRDGKLDVEGLKARERTVKWGQGHVLVATSRP